MTGGAAHRAAIVHGALDHDRILLAVLPRLHPEADPRLALTLELVHVERVQR